MVARRRLCVVGLLVLGAAIVGAPGAPGGSTKVAGPHYVSPAGDDSNPGTKSRPWRTLQHAADRLRAGQTVFVRGGTYRERVQPRHSGAPGRYVTFAAYPGEAPVIDGAGVTLPADQAGLFELRGRGYVRVSGLRIANARPDDNSNGILVAESHHVVLENNRTVDTRSSGIGVWGSRNVVVRGNEIVRACTAGAQESLTVAGTDTFEVVDNTVRGGGKEGIDAKDGSRNGRIHGNLVHDVPAVGIYVDAWDKPTANIEVSGNTVRDVTNGDGIALASEMGGTLANVRIVNNLVYDTAFVGIAITRNGAEGRRHPMLGVTIANNTIWSNGKEWGGGIAVDDPDARKVVVRNNIVAANRSFQLSVSADVAKKDAIVDHTLIDGYRGSRDDGEVRGESYVEGSPLFVDARAGDFHLRAGSPAIDRGSARGAPRADFDGKPRPRGAGVDIGAFEY
jgi:hypothetical protein